MPLSRYRSFEPASELGIDQDLRSGDILDPDGPSGWPTAEGLGLEHLDADDLIRKSHPAYPAVFGIISRAYRSCSCNGCNSARPISPIVGNARQRTNDSYPSYVDARTRPRACANQPVRNSPTNMTREPDSRARPRVPETPTSSVPPSTDTPVALNRCQSEPPVASLLGRHQPVRRWWIPSGRKAGQSGGQAARWRCISFVLLAAAAHAASLTSCARSLKHDRIDLWGCHYRISRKPGQNVALRVLDCCAISDEHPSFISEGSRGSPTNDSQLKLVMIAYESSEIKTLA